MSVGSKIGINHAQIRCGLARLSEDKSRHWQVSANRCAVNVRCHLFSPATTVKHLLRGRTMPQLRMGLHGELASNGPAIRGGLAQGCSGASQVREVQ